MTLQVQELSTELDEYRQSVPDLEDRIVGLQAETDSQDKALREAEERYEKIERQNADYQLQIKQNKQEIEDLQSDLNNERKKRKGLKFRGTRLCRISLMLRRPQKITKGKQKIKPER